MDANLHLHSRFSDGTLWPDEIAVKAASFGLELVALTDHDTLAGVPEFLSVCASLGLQAIPACEIDCAIPELGYKSELLAYFPTAHNPRDYENTELLLRGLLRRREERIRVFVERARFLFRRSALSFDDLLAWKMDSHHKDGLPIDPATLSMNKLDLFSYLKARSVIDPDVSYREFKKAYFSTGLIRDDRPQRRPRLRAEEAIKAVHADGGVLVIPHLGHEFEDDPECMTEELERLRRVLLHFKGLGVGGVEMYWYRNSDTDRINRIIRRVAEPLGYFFTHGSDCHGPGSDKDSLGRYSGEFPGFPNLKV